MVGYVSNTKDTTLIIHVLVKESPTKFGIPQQRHAGKKVLLF